MSIKIYGEYRGKTEVLDSSDNSNDAAYLVREYRMAFGPYWRVWADEDAMFDAQCGENAEREAQEK